MAEDYCGIKMYLIRFFGEFFTTIWMNILLILISYGTILLVLYSYEDESVIQISLVLLTVSAMFVLIGSRPDVSLSWKYFKTVIGRIISVACHIVFMFFQAGLAAFLTGSYWLGLLLLPVIFLFNSNSIYLTTSMSDDEIRFLPLKEGYWLERFVLAAFAGLFIFILKIFIVIKPVLAAGIVLTALIYFIMGKVSYEEGLRKICENGPPLPKFLWKKATLIEKFIMFMEHHARKGVGV
ncbi:hypothetical protein [Desulfovibrio sp. JC022]|uniref:hypothetical protein n=1 Tax=Desulfovibrio sp. JC022 TaxID=2593642 RepID=UPI0013D304CC|nr:hypothetical protein [Desulfovibrio sp. JC022]NDV24056.1 hypothetical protein [Desulfovibrio sp. JC022]